MNAPKNPLGTDDYGACRCCTRWFVENVIDPVTEARHNTDGYCGGCAKAAQRAGTTVPPCRHGLIPAAEYRCGFTTEQNTYHALIFLRRIAGTSERLRQWPLDPNFSASTSAGPKERSSATTTAGAASPPTSSTTTSGS